MSGRNTETGQLIQRLSLLLLLATPFAMAETSQEHVHRMSPQVMPFAMGETLHIFRMTESGGVQQVIARNPDNREQVNLIRQHLRHEAGRFQQGDYTGPQRLHGADMPGLKTLSVATSEIEVTYASLPDGAEIRFVAHQLKLITAIHRWFGAQLSEHGADAKAE